MWKYGTLNGFNWCVKVYETGSQYGINGGRISKLWIQQESNKEIIANYDRGWDIKPSGNTPEGIEVYNYLIEKFN